MKHTPKPWQVYFGYNDGHLYAGHTSPSSDQAGAWTEEDRRLIEAAPDLLEACEQAVLAFASISGESANLMRTDELNRLSAAASYAAAAIRKANGGVK